MIIDLWLDFYEYESRKDTSINRLRFPPGKLNYHLYYILLFGDTAICFLFDLKNDHLNVQVIFTSDCISQISLTAQRTKKPIILEKYGNIITLFESKHTYTPRLHIFELTFFLRCDEEIIL